MKVGFITLGCDKNTVDTERYLAELSGYGGEYTPALGEADVIIVNTCGFIDAAKKESIDAMIEAARYKIDGACRAVVGVGCMIERHKAELTEALPEIDLFLVVLESGAALLRTCRARNRRWLIRLRCTRGAHISRRSATRSLSEDQRRVRPRLRVLRHSIERASTGRSRQQK